MGLWSKRVDPVDVAMSLSSIANTYAELMVDDSTALATEVNADIDQDVIGANLATTLYAIALVGARQEMGGSDKFAIVEMAMQPLLAAILESNGVEDAQGRSRIVFPSQAAAYVQRASQSANPLFSIGSTFVEAISEVNPRSAVASFEAIRILTPFLAAVAREVKDKRL